MALEAVVFQQDPFGQGSSSKDLYNLMGSAAAIWGSYDEEFSKEDEDFSFLGNQTENSPNYYHCGSDQWNYYSCVDPSNFLNEPQAPPPQPQPPHDDSSSPVGQIVGGGRWRAARRRRWKTEKNKEEIENQRMTHITVERNRRKQMNHYLSVLRSLMPHSYVQRGDQASIIGGAINFVKELEQQVHFLSAQTHVKPSPNAAPNIIAPPFSHFFSFPHYSSSTSTSTSTSASAPSGLTSMAASAVPSNQIQSSLADVEVSMVDSHANLKIRCKKLPKQLLKIVSGLHRLHLSVLHLNVSTLHQIVLYSFSLKVEEYCGLSSVDEIARAVHQLVCRIQEEAFSL
ncbi:transcription factor bHLH94-like [Momordica charantia]|uniref:Transcription factor bHLH94-like n=1 Tax=Momordica charantia TaxID=3673 RepID=A0A6J1E2W2_MOMCH|nr:transcription factor bHLH94-like [Momordica charantia]